METFIFKLNEMKPLTQETEYITMSKDLFKLFIGNAFTGGVLYDLMRATQSTELSQDEAQQNMVDSAMSQADGLTI